MPRLPGQQFLEQRMGRATLQPYPGNLLPGQTRGARDCPQGHAIKPQRRTDAGAEGELARGGDGCGQKYLAEPGPGGRGIGRGRCELEDPDTGAPQRAAGFAEPDSDLARGVRSGQAVKETQLVSLLRAEGAGEVERVVPVLDARGVRAGVRQAAVQGDQARVLTPPCPTLKPVLEPAVGH